MKQFVRVLAVSQTEAITGLFLFVGLVFYIVISIISNQNYVQQAFESFTQLPPEATSTYTAVSDQINSSELVGNATIFVLWSVIGMIVLLLGYVVFVSEHSVESFMRMLLWRGADRSAILEDAAGRLAIRVAALMGFMVGIIVFVRYGLPYIVLNLDTDAGRALFPDHALAIGLTALLLGITLHVGVVLLRCLLLRVRVFF